MVREGIVLEHLVSERGIEVDKAKIELIEHLPPPINIAWIRSFLGHAGFYRRFIKDFLFIARPLTRLLAKDIPFEFDDACLHVSVFYPRGVTPTSKTCVRVPFPRWWCKKDTKVYPGSGKRRPYVQLGGDVSIILHLSACTGVNTSQCCDGF